MKLKNAAQMTANPGERTRVDTTVAIEQAVAEMHIPDSIRADFAGDVQAFKQAIGA